MSAARHQHAREAQGVEPRLAAIDWQAIAADLDSMGWAIFTKLLTPTECREISGLYEDGKRFRSKVVMARHGFGRGEYQYFAYPLPDLVADLRRALYPHLAPIKPITLE